MIMDLMIIKYHMRLALLLASGGTVSALCPSGSLLVNEVRIVALKGILRIRHEGREY